MLAQNRLVWDVKSALDLDNYEPLEIPSAKKEIKWVIKVDREEKPTSQHYFQIKNLLEQDNKQVKM